MTALNVGQGASAILSSEGETALVDCGSSNSFMDAGDIAADTLAAYGYNYLDYLILTHYHADHANGLEVLLSRTEVGRMLLPSIEQEDGLRERVLALAENYGIEVAYVLEEESFPLGEASVRIYPPLGSGGANEEGLTILCTAGDFDVLITGDMDADTERRLIETYELPDIEVLLAGHHGSKYSTSQELLENTLPEVGIISVGSNSYGHPTKEAMDRMREQGMSLYRTDLQGSISIVIK